MADAAQEMIFKLVIETLGADAIEKAGEAIVDNAEEAVVLSEDQLKLITEQFTKVEKILALQKDAVKTAEVMSKLHKDDVGLLKSQQQELLAARAILRDVMSTPKEFGKIAGPQLDAVVKLGRHIEQVDKSIDDALSTTKEWKKALKDVGLDKIADSAKKLMTVGGQVGMWAGMVSENIKQGALWMQQNYQMYGSMQEVADGVRGMKEQYGLLQKEAGAAMKAVADVSMAGDPKAIKAIAGAVGEFAMLTGASVEQSAKLVKQYRVQGHSLETAKKQFIALRNSAANYGITGKDMDVINQYMTKNMQNLAATAGGSAEKMTELGDNIAAAGGMAKMAGLDMNQFGSIMQDLTTDATKYAVLLGDQLMGTDPGKMFMTMAKNAGAAADKLSEIEEPWIRNTVAMAQYNMGYDDLARMGKAYDDLAKAAKTTGISVEDMLKPGAKLNAVQKEALETNRDLLEPGRQFQLVLENLKNIFVDLLGPIIEATAGVASFIGWCLKNAWVKGLVIAIAALVAILVVLRWTITTFAILGAIIPWFKKFTVALRGVSRAADKTSKGASGLNKFGKGMREFVSQIAKIDWGKAFKAAGIMLILGGALLVLGLAAKLMDVNNLLEVGVGMIAFAGALWIMTKVMKNVEGDWKKIAISLGILAIGLGVFAFAMHLMDKKGSMTPIEAMVALAAAFVVLAIGSRIMGNAAGSMIKASIAIAIMGAAMIPMAYAMNLMAAVGWGTVAMMVVTLVAMAVALGLLSVLAGPIIATSVAIGIFGIALVIVAAALLIASHAFERFVSQIVILAGIGLMAIGIEMAAGGAMMLIGVAAMFAAMVIGAAMIAPAAIFWAAAKLVRSGFAAIMEGFGGDIGNLVVMGKYVYPALYGLAVGIDAVVAAHWYKFWRASDEIGEGMMAIAGGMIAFAFAAAFAPKAAASLTKLSAGIKSFGGSSGFVKAAVGFRSAVRIIGDGLMYYGSYVENAANKVLGAVFKVGMAQQALKWLGLDEIIKSAATVTVKADVEDKKKESEDRLTQTELLEDIKASIQSLTAVVGDIVAGGDAADKVEKVHKLLNEYLPAIAEGDSKLSVGNTNQW